MHLVYRIIFIFILGSSLHAGELEHEGLFGSQLKLEQDYYRELSEQTDVDLHAFVMKHKSLVREETLKTLKFLNKNVPDAAITSVSETEARIYSATTRNAVRYFNQDKEVIDALVENLKHQKMTELFPKAKELSIREIGEYGAFAKDGLLDSFVSEELLNDRDVEVILQSISRREDIADVKHRVELILQEIYDRESSEQTPVSQCITAFADDMGMTVDKGEAETVSVNYIIYIILVLVVFVILILFIEAKRRFTHS